MSVLIRCSVMGRIFWGVLGWGGVFGGDECFEGFEGFEEWDGGL